MALTGFDIMEDVDAGEYKDLYEIFGGISEAWGDLSDTQQARVSEILGGTRQLQVISSILNNWDDAIGAYDDAMNSAGTATQANDTYMESMEAHLNVLSASMQELWTDTFSSDFLNGWIDFGNAIVNVIDDVGMLQTALLAVVGVMSARGAGLFDFSAESGFSKFATEIGESISGFYKSIQESSTKNGGRGILRTLLFGSGETVDVSDVLGLDEAEHALKHFNESTAMYKGSTEVFDFDSWIDDMQRSGQMSSQCAEAMKEYSKSADLGRASAQNLVDTNTKLRASQEKVNSSMSTSGLLGSLKSVGTQFLTVAANVAIAMAAMAAVSAVVNAVSTAWDNYINKAEKAIEAGQEAQSAIADINDEYKNTASTVNSIDMDTYTEYLSKVNRSTNANAGLTNEEYEEYVSISNQLGELFPSLVTGFDSQGNAMLSLSTNADTATDSLNALLEQERQLANQEIAEQMQDVATGLVYENEELEKQIEEYQEAVDLYGEAAKNAESMSTGEIPDFLSVQFKDTDLYNVAFDIASDSADVVESATSNFLEALKNSDLGGRYEETTRTINENLAEGIYRQGYQLINLTQEEVSRLKEEYQKVLEDAQFDTSTYTTEDFLNFSEAESNLRLAEAQQKQLWSELAPSLQSYVSTLGDFLDISENADMQDTLINGINRMIGSFDITSLDTEGLEAIQTDVKGWVNDTFISPILEASVAGREDVLKAYSTLFEIDLSNMNITQAKDVINEAVETIFPEDEEAQVNLKLMLGLDVETESGVIEASWVETIQGIADTLGIKYNEAYGYFKDANWDIGDIEIGYNLVLNNSNIDSLDELSEKVEQTKQSLKGSISLYDLLSDEDDNNFSDKIDSFQSDIKDISSALDDLRNGEEVSLTDLVQDFPELVNSLNDLEGGLTKLSLEKLDEFSSEWRETFSGASTEELEKANKLFNEMVSNVDISTYMDQYKEAFAEYEDIAAEVAESSVDTAETVFGNIDTNNRQILEWTERNLSEYQNAIESWGMSTEDLAGQYSTILSMSGEYGGAEITFSPMLQTENGPVLLTKDAVDNYLTQLVESLPEGWTEADLITADAQGISGSYISGLVAGITESADEAERLGEAMHLVGDTGAYQNAENGLKKINDQLRNTAFNNVVENLGRDQLGAETEAYNNLVQLFDMYAGNEAALEAIVKISANPDAANWTIDEWIAQLEDEEVYIQLRISAENLDDLQDELSALEDEQKLLESSQSLSEAMGIKKTTQDYKKLINNSKKQVKNIQDQNKELETQKKIYEDLGRDTKDIESQIADNLSSINSAIEDQLEWHELTLTLNYDQAVEGVEAFRTALSESTSDTLLAQDTIKSLMDTFSDLSSYDLSTLFYKTSAGVDVNTTSLKELEEEYVNLKKQDYVDQLAGYGREYTQAKSYVDALGKSYDELSAKEKEAMTAAGYRGLDEIEQDITEVDLLIGELDGLTSAYETWVNAASSGNQRDAFESMGDYYSTAEDLINRGWYNNEGLNAYLDLMLSAEQRSGNAIDDFNKLTETIEGTDHSLVDYFQYNDNGDLVNDGIYAFVDDVISTMGEGYARIDEETGNYEFGMWSEQDVQDIADRFGTTADYIWKLVDAAQEAGFELTTTQDYIQDALNAMTNVDTSALQDLQAEGKLNAKIDLNYDIEELSTDEISDKLSDLDEIEHELFVDMDVGAIDWDTYIEALSELEALRDALNSQDIRLRVETEMEEGNLQELDEIIGNGEYEEEIALRFGIDMEEEGWQDEVHAIAEVIQEEAQGERIEMAVESKIEETGMTAAELSNEIDGLKDQEILDYFEIDADASEAEAVIDYVNAQAEAEKTWDVVVKVEDEQFNQLLDAINGEEATVDVTADTGEAESEVNSFVSETDGTEATLEYTTSASDSDVSSIVSEIEALEPTVHVLADIDQAKSDINGLVDLLPEEGTTITVTAETSGLEELQSLSGAIDEVLDKTVNVVADVSGESEVRSLTSAINALTGKIVSVSAQVSGRSEVEALRSSIAAVNSKTVTITSVTKEVTELLGSAHVGGTTVNNTWNDYRHSIGAYAGGTWHDWSIPQDELALTNEVGTESIVLKMRLYMATCIENLSNC